ETDYPYNYGYNIYISNDSGLMLVATNWNVYNFYYKAGSSWAPQDCVYFYDSRDGSVKYTNGITNGYKDYYTYTKGIEIPSARTYFGDNFYFYSYWPLKYLTLDDMYSSYQITRKVVDEYSFTNEWEWEGTNYTNIYTWTYYDWWLDKEGDKSYSNNVDININGVLNVQTVYLWDNNFGNFVEQNAIFAYGTGDKPLYFKFSQENLISNVNQKIEDLYTNASGQNVIDFITNRQIPNPENFPSF
ncbi:MAG: hypothetical protein ACP5QT_08030, partial [Brevinematia bacterium]